MVVGVDTRGMTAFANTYGKGGPVAGVVALTHAASSSAVWLTVTT